METSSLCVTQWTQNWSRSRLFGRTIDLAYEQLKKAICCTLNAMVVNLWYLVINNATMICLVGYLLWILLINMSHCLCCNYLWPMSWLDATRVATAHWFSLQQCTILCKGASHLSYLDTICSMNPSQRDWFSFFFKRSGLPSFICIRSWNMLHGARSSSKNSFPITCRKKAQKMAIIKSE